MPEVRVKPLPVDSMDLFETSFRSTSISLVVESVPGTRYTRGMSASDRRSPVFIGDIQGCREELEALLEALRFDPASQRLHPVGDLVNRGPDSLGTLRLLRQLDAGGVLGNHDLHALGLAAGSRRPGSRDTLDELLQAEDRDELLGWLAGRPLIRDFGHLLCVHAALHPAWSDPVAVLTQTPPDPGSPACAFATRARYCDPRGRQPDSDWPPPSAPFLPWDVHWRARPGETRSVVFGHWARRGLVALPRTRGLDTGCVWGHALTAWIADEDRWVSVPARKVHSPTSLP